MGGAIGLGRGEMVALGWTLLHFCWQGTAVAMVYALADRVTSRASSGVRYAVALLALALMPMAVALTFAVEMRVQVLQGFQGGTQGVPQEVEGVVSVSGEREVRLLAGSGLREIAPVLTELVEGRPAWLAAPAEHLLPWVDGAWVAGVLLLAMRAFGGWWQLEQVRRRAAMAVPEEVERSFRRIAERVRVGREVALRVSAEVISPMAMGVWRGTVLLPLGALLRLSVEEVEAVLAHELAHIRRWDYVCNLLQTAVESVLFFHPAVWRLSGTVRERREVCCDEIAVGSCADAVVYARALLRLEEQRRADMRLALALHGTGGSLLVRVKRVLGEAIPMEARMTSGVRIATAGAVTIGLLLGPKVSDAVGFSRRSETPVVLRQEPATVAAAAIAREPEQSGPRGERGPRAALALVRPSVRAVVARSQPVSGAGAALVSGTLSASQARFAFEAAVAEAAPAMQAYPRLLARLQAAGEATAPAGPAGPSHQGTVPRSEAGAVPGNAPGNAPGKTYMDAMRDAGYEMSLDGDLNLLVVLKSIGVTPEYAKAMGAVGLGKPTVPDLITLKSLGVTPEYVVGLRQSGIGPKDFHEVVTERALGVTAEYSSALEKQGFRDLDVRELIEMKAQGLTPEYAAWMKKEFPEATMEELKRARFFHLDDKFLALARAHGFADKDLERLLRLKISGLLDQ